MKKENMSLEWANGRCRVKFSILFISLGISYFCRLFVVVVVVVVVVLFFLLPKYPFYIEIKFSIIKIPRFKSVLSKMEYIQTFQTGRSKMAEGHSSFFSNKWSHHDIAGSVKDSLCVSHLLDFIRHLIV